MDKKSRVTPQSKDFSKWYQDIVREADLAEVSEVRGCGIVKPYGYKIWELIKEYLSKKIEATGVENVYFPIFLPVKNLEMEKDHVEGFAPELAVVTHGGGEELVEKLAVRPTSEAAMYKTYAKWIQSHKDLPMRLNQWNNVVRWEKRPRPFLRWAEFLWQEGHTVFATKEEALAEMWQMLDVYRDTYENFLKIPTFFGKKSNMEKFAGADITVCIEVMARDGRSIQGATSHYLGTNFSKVFDIKFLDKNGESQYAHQNSWGFSWRSIGALIMAHGDDKGLRLPSKVAPIQVVIVPIFKDINKSKVLSFVEKIKANLGDNLRIQIDAREDLTPGFKFNHWEMKGVPLRLEIGEKEVDNNEVTIFRRDNSEKTKEKIDNLKEIIIDLLEKSDENLYAQALEFRGKHIHRIESIDEINDQIGYFEASWCEDVDTEKLLKEEFSMVSRVLPKELENQPPKNKKCFISGKEAKHDWYFAKSY